MCINFPLPHYLTEPSDVNEAFNEKAWMSAMNESLEQNDTWDLVSLPSGKHPIGCKWVYQIKRNADGTINKFKASLVVKGFHKNMGKIILDLLHHWQKQ